MSFNWNSFGTLCFLPDKGVKGMEQFINIDVVTTCLKYGTYAIVCGTFLTILFELVVYGIIKAFNLLKL